MMIAGVRIVAGILASIALGLGISLLVSPLETEHQVAWLTLANAPFVLLMARFWIDRGTTWKSTILVVTIIIEIATRIVLLVMASINNNNNFLTRLVFAWHLCLLLVVDIGLIGLALALYVLGSPYWYRPVVSNGAPLELFHVDILRVSATYRIGMSPLPGRMHYQCIRDLESDLARICDTYSFRRIVSLNEDCELQSMNYSLTVLETRSRARGIENRQFAIRDKFIPSDFDAFARCICECVRYLRGGQEDAGLLVHCRGGIGRTGMTVVCIQLLLAHVEFVQLGATDLPRTMIECIRLTRLARPRTIRSPLQILFAYEFGARLDHVYRIYEQQ